ncbi:MAG TPA: dipeptide epimerase, partial [Paludibacter sp.]|nr:dipeptide epimerase [Paludibacter sp.]
MGTNRRDFLKVSGTLLGLSLLENKIFSAPLFNIASSKSNTKMKLSFQKYNLILKHVFTVASNSRTSTPVVLTQIEYDGFVGYGEASMPPYLGETQESVLSFLNKVDLSKFNDPFRLDEILAYVDSIDQK